MAATMAEHGRAYWADRTGARRRTSYPRLRGSHTADVVVIGGGLTGCTAAYVLAAGGLHVVLVEAARLAGGATAGGLGAIVPQPDASFRAMEKVAGLRVARTAWKETRRSGLDFAAVLRKLSIRCDLAPTSLVINARAAEEAQALRREQAARKAAGLDAPWLAAEAVRAETGTGSSGAIRMHDAFTFDPVRAALGLASAATRRKVRIFEQSPVRRTTFTRRHADVILEGGTISTRGVLVATGAPGTLFRQLRRHVRELEGHLVVTEPLTAAMRRETGRRLSLLTEAGEAPHWLRWLPDHRAVFAGAVGRPVGPRLRDRAFVQRTAQLMYELSVLYPVISGLPARWGWPAPVVTGIDGLPWVGPHRNYPFHFFSLGFGWHGDGLAWFAAKAALRHFTSAATREDEEFGFDRIL
jgi:glycine/D-amino acid oxidase-like deaminating enzyme